MNSRILLLGLATAALTSCATAYKTGQTPDDVYYSPVRAEDEYVRTEQEEDRYSNNDYVSLDDRRLRMQIRNRNRYCACNDDWYWDSWNSSSSWRYGWNNPWTWNSNVNNGWYYSYNSWCYSPFPAQTNVFTPKKTFNYKPPIRNFGNSNTVTTYYNPKAGSSPTPSKSSVRVYNNSNRGSGSGFGGFLRQILSPSGSSNSSSSGSGNNSRTYNPSSSNSSGGSRSSGSSSSGSSGSSRPARNGKGG